MHYDFNEHIERRGTHSLKHDMVGQIWGREDLIPMWVADMDFATPPFVIEAVKHRLDNRVLGYTVPYDEYFERVVAWNKHRYGFDVKKEEICQVPGVVAGINNALQAFTKPGENVMIMQPVYHPFRLVTEAIGRNVVDCPLLFVNGRYEVDFNLMEKLAPSCKALILCNPHNPGGFTWKPETLKRIADICFRCGVVVIDDEIHADLVFNGYKHTPFLSVSAEAEAVGVTLQSPTKAFNMPGVIAAHTIVKDSKLRTRFFDYLRGSDADMLSAFSYDCVSACYTPEGEEWLNQMLEYVRGNIEYVCRYCSENIPSVRPICPEASFLVFLDCRQLGFSSQKRLNSFFVDKARLALNSGDMFGHEGTGYMRMNVGCPRAVVEEAMERLASACRSIADAE